MRLPKLVLAAPTAACRLSPPPPPPFPPPSGSAVTAAHQDVSVGGLPSVIVSRGDFVPMALPALKAYVACPTDHCAGNVQIYQVCCPHFISWAMGLCSCSVYGPCGRLFIGAADDARGSAPWDNFLRAECANAAARARGNLLAPTRAISPRQMRVASAASTATVAPSASTELRFNVRNTCTRYRAPGPDGQRGLAAAGWHPHQPWDAQRLRARRHRPGHERHRHARQSVRSLLV